MNRWPLFLLTLAAGLLLGWWTIQTPTPVDASAPADQFSAGRAMVDVRVLAREPHPTGTQANLAGIAHMERRLATLGFTTRRVVTPLNGKPAQRLAKWGGDPSQPAISLVAIRRGGDAALPAVALLAHHDSVWASPGAADDIAGVAAALEIARAIPQARQRRDLVLIFTDAEELGLVGARAIYRDNEDPIAARTGVLINLEARGGGGRAMMFQTGPQNGDLVRRLADVTPGASASSLAVTLYESLPNDTDFTPVKDRGIAGLNFAFIGDAWGYHSPLMTPDRLDQGALQHLGDSVLAITRDLVTAPALPARSENAVFASAPLIGIIAYSPATGWGLLAAIAGLLVIAALWRRAEWSLGGMLMALGQAVLALIIAGLLMFGLNLLSGSVGGEYYDRLAALPRLEMVAALAALAVLLFLAAAPAGSLWDRWLTWAALCFAGALVAQIVLPGAGPVLAWPALLAAIAAVLGARPGTTGMAQVAPAALLAIPGLALGAELFHFAFLGIGAPMPFATVPLLIPVLALLAPMLPDGPGSLGNRRPALLAGAAAVLLAAGLALWVNLDPVAPSVPPYAGTEKKQG
ncbi:M20/M25/M40 family metallo-hydrolase [Sandarakinorhabdus sp. AAP62]|uniref:M20/M25/M40 family metallo-hydrolase n=1 Tax=Sandarakinorhabdus sp. AAP62 TaxID=1248916 RepID=UPI000309C3C0|nr:M20/M25/M40 family metallo-hydrolase [Sandarakinorhabdus sp. AAP62]